MIDIKNFKAIKRSKSGTMFLMALIVGKFYKNFLLIITLTGVYKTALAVCIFFPYSRWI